MVNIDKLLLHRVGTRGHANFTALLLGRLTLKDSEENVIGYHNKTLRHSSVNTFALCASLKFNIAPVHSSELNQHTCTHSKVIAFTKKKVKDEHRNKNKYNTRHRHSFK